MTMPGEVPPRRRPWALDNGAYRAWRKGEACDFAPFERALVSADDVAFVVAPDLPAAGLESLELSRSWLPRLHGRPAYLAAQDGMPLDSIAKALEDFDGLFIGGTIGWKLKTGGALVELAHRMGKRCHVGRCGSAKRILWAYSIGADSIDSSLPLWSEENLRAATRAIEMGRRQLQLGSILRAVG